MACSQFSGEVASTMLHYEGDDQQYLQFQNSCEAIIVAFVNMRVDPETTSNVCQKGLGMSKPVKSKENVKASGGIESSVDVEQLLKTAQEVESSLDASGRVPNGFIVPPGLTPAMRADITTLKQGDVSHLYNVQSTGECVRDGSLTSTEYVTLHLRSFRNICQVELSDVDQLKRRFLRFFARVFMEVVDLCYPDRGDSSLVSAS